MVDFREYLQLEEYLLDEKDDFYMESFDDAFDSFSYDESPFQPIKIGSYILYLYASEQNLCYPQLNSTDKHFYKSWEVCIERFHPKYGYVICTAEVMNELGYEAFEPEDYFIAYAENELVQQIFDTLVDKLYIPE